MDLTMKNVLSLSIALALGATGAVVHAQDVGPVTGDVDVNAEAATAPVDGAVTATTDTIDHTKDHAADASVEADAAVDAEAGDAAVSADVDAEAEADPEA
jgi:hypothetical protein